MYTVIGSIIYKLIGTMYTYPYCGSLINNQLQLQLQLTIQRPRMTERIEVRGTRALHVAEEAHNLIYGKLGTFRIIYHDHDHQDSSAEYEQVVYMLRVSESKSELLVMGLQT